MHGGLRAEEEEERLEEDAEERETLTRGLQAFALVGQRRVFLGERRERGTGGLRAGVGDPVVGGRN